MGFTTTSRREDFKTSIELQLKQRGTLRAMGTTPTLHLKRNSTVFFTGLKGQSSPPPAHQIEQRSVIRARAAMCFKAFGHFSQKGIVCGSEQVAVYSPSVYFHEQ